MTGGVGDDAPYTEFFHRSPGRIEHVANRPRESVNGPAKRVLEALGLIIVEPPLIDEP